MLNEALATELVCVLRYKRHHYMAEGINAAPVAAEFLQQFGDASVQDEKGVFRD